MTFYQKTENGYLLRVRCQPNSSCCQISGVMQDANRTTYLKVSLISVPEKGKANKELIDFFSKMFDIPKSSFSVVSGQTDRWKKIEILTLKNIDDKLKEVTNARKNH